MSFNKSFSSSALPIGGFRKQGFSLATNAGSFEGSRQVAASSTARGRAFFNAEAAKAARADLLTSSDTCVLPENHRTSQLDSLKGMPGFIDHWSKVEVCKVSVSLRKQFPIFGGFGVTDQKAYFTFLSGEAIRYEAHVSGLINKISEKGKREELMQMLFLVSYAVQKFDFEPTQVSQCVNIFENLLSESNKKILDAALENSIKSNLESMKESLWEEGEKFDTVCERIQNLLENVENLNDDSLGFDLED